MKYTVYCHTPNVFDVSVSFAHKYARTICVVKSSILRGLTSYLCRLCAEKMLSFMLKQREWSTRNYNFGVFFRLLLLFSGHCCCAGTRSFVSNSRICGVQASQGTLCILNGCHLERNKQYKKNRRFETGKNRSCVLRRRLLEEWLNAVECCTSSLQTNEKISAMRVNLPQAEILTHYARARDRSLLYALMSATDKRRLREFFLFFFYWLPAATDVLSFIAEWRTCTISLDRDCCTRKVNAPRQPRSYSVRSSVIHREIRNKFWLCVVCE